ncbi:hypothetical protein EQG49_00780 [Periweissella cryptocerci]|uniref:Uncharacterized protein n=1 Tax=Periweissella cryptocerci TaxID=2506420 RepID=A0A4P6YR43_9LACO|nr:hypothetical protein [Periweissella cryptocerci]QBO35088.1 hypothetical protein EQG49_00780 [Periweissella cryptocerci]
MKFLALISVVLSGVLMWVWHTFTTRLGAMQHQIPNVMVINNWLHVYFYVVISAIILIVLLLILRKPKLLAVGIVLQIGILYYAVIGQANAVNQQDVRYFKVAAGGGRYKKLAYNDARQLTRDTGQYLIYVNPAKGKQTRELQQYIKAHGIILRTLRIQINTNLNLLAATAHQPRPTSTPIFADKPMLIVVGQASVMVVNKKAKQHLFGTVRTHELKTTSDFINQIALFYH